MGAHMRGIVIFLLACIALFSTENASAQRAKGKILLIAGFHFDKVEDPKLTDRIFHKLEGKEVEFVVKAVATYYGIPPTAVDIYRKQVRDLFGYQKAEGEETRGQ